MQGKFADKYKIKIDNILAYILIHVYVRMHYCNNYMISICIQNILLIRGSSLFLVWLWEDFSKFVDTGTIKFKGWSFLDTPFNSNILASAFTN